EDSRANLVGASEPAPPGRCMLYEHHDVDLGAWVSGASDQLWGRPHKSAYVRRWQTLPIVPPATPIDRAWSGGAAHRERAARGVVDWLHRGDHGRQSQQESTSASRKRSRSHSDS